MKRSLLLFPLVVSLAFTNGCSEQKGQALTGTWKMESCTYSGAERNESAQPKDVKRFCLKIYSPPHFAVVEMFEDNPDSLLFAALGTYELGSSRYMEKYDASNVNYETTTWREFDYSLQGDRLTMTRSADDMALQEVWVRVDQ